MVKTTVYLPEELDTQLEAEAASSGVSKAELIRQGISMVLDQTPHSRQPGALPVFNSGRQLTLDDMDQLVSERITDRAARR